MFDATVIIATLNEEKNIARAIASVKPLFAEVIVVDSLSQDATVAIAESMGARVLVQEYLGDGLQKRFAVARATHDWIFVLDADEVAPANLAELIAPSALDPKTVYCFKRKNYVGSHWLRHGGAYPDWVSRFFNRTTHEITPTIEHCYVPSSRYYKVKGDIEHYSHADTHAVYEKTVRHAYRSAKFMYQTGRSPALAWPSALWMFLKLYVVKRGFLDGRIGFDYAFAAALRSYLKYSFLAELHRDPVARSAANFKKIF